MAVALVARDDRHIVVQVHHVGPLAFLVRSIHGEDRAARIGPVGEGAELVLGAVLVRPAGCRARRERTHELVVRDAAVDGRRRVGQREAVGWQAVQAFAHPRRQTTQLGGVHPEQPLFKDPGPDQFQLRHGLLAGRHLVEGHFAFGRCVLLPLPTDPDRGSRALVVEGAQVLHLAFAQPRPPDLQIAEQLGVYRRAPVTDAATIAVGARIFGNRSVHQRIALACRHHTVAPELQVVALLRKEEVAHLAHEDALIRVQYGRYVRLQIHQGRPNRGVLALHLLDDHPVLIAPVQQALSARCPHDPRADEGIGVDGLGRRLQGRLGCFAGDQFGHPGGEVSGIDEMMRLRE